MSELLATFTAGVIDPHAIYSALAMPPESHDPTLSITPWVPALSIITKSVNLVSLSTVPLKRMPGFVKRRAMALSRLVACVHTHPPIFNRSKHATFALTQTQAGARVLLPAPGKINRPVHQDIPAENIPFQPLLIPWIYLLIFTWPTV
jgi:hypothetical protein